MAVLKSKTLNHLIEGWTNIRRQWSEDPEISSIVYDSRKVVPGSLFVALRGQKADGTIFIRDAIAKGAAAIVVEELPYAQLGVPVLLVPNGRKALAELAWSFYDHPERSLTFTGITGTNGKTTTATVLQHVLEFSGRHTGLAGTLGFFYGNIAVESSRTTPESVDLALHFAAMREQGILHVAMEATSIGIDLERTWGIPFAVTVLTNLTRDHLDYHGTEEAYRNAKLRLFQEQGASGTAIINIDDPAADFFMKAAAAKVRTYSLTQAADYRAEKIALTPRSTSFDLIFGGERVKIESPMLGEFNVYNLLAVIGAAHAQGVPMAVIQEALKQVPAVRGRAERVTTSAPFTVVVDYAHTPDALEKILTTLRSLKPNRIFTIIGAGGDRDRGKRPLMAQTACRLSDVLYLTSDNPRSEDPEAILSDMSAGLPGDSTYFRNPDRREAIEDALTHAGSGDIVLIAGKGHETYQEIAGVKYPFDDREIARTWLQQAGYTL
jgi:UDP-N-acetylmuramoyl-L-alanyl-D-glutamate--2,6-diaminopimelate ligase